MVAYYKLWDLLNRRGLKKTCLRKEPVSLASRTLAKLGKNEYVSTETIDRICSYLEVQPGDIMEWIPDDNHPDDN